MGPLLHEYLVIKKSLSFPFVLSKHIATKPKMRFVISHAKLTFRACTDILQIEFQIQFLLKDDKFLLLFYYDKIVHKYLNKLFFNPSSEFWCARHILKNVLFIFG